MIDLNDAQINKYGQSILFSTNTTFKDHIEKGRCYGLKNAKYIVGLYFTLNITELYGEK